MNTSQDLMEAINQVLQKFSAKTDKDRDKLRVWFSTSRLREL